MKRVRDLLVDGTLLALPLAAAAFLLGQAIGQLRRLLAPVAQLLPAGHVWGVALLELAALCALVLVLLALGLFARSAAGGKLAHWLEDAVLSKVPGYLMLKSVAAGFTGTEYDGDPRPALVSFDDNTVLGFVVEESTAHDTLTVFVPSAPTAASGSVVLVPRDRVELLDVATGPAMRAMKRRGLGLQQLVRLPPRGPAPGAGA